MSRNLFWQHWRSREKFNSAQKNHFELQILELVFKYSRWVPHELLEKNLHARTIICTYLLTQNKNEPSLNRIINDDEKLTTYENILKKRTYCGLRQSYPFIFKPNLSLNKKILCIVGQPRRIYYELFNVTKSLIQWDTDNIWIILLKDLNKKIFKIKRYSALNMKILLYSLVS